MDRCCKIQSGVSAQKERQRRLLGGLPRRTVAREAQPVAAGRKLVMADYDRGDLSARVMGKDWLARRLADSNDVLCLSLEATCP